MLVLNRQRDEEIYIDDDKIKVSVADIRGDRTRIGINAPEYPVHRREIYDAMMSGSGNVESLAKKGTGGKLVLTRQIDESIMIGDNVEIFIVNIRGEKVRLGINAPPQMSVHRKEVYEVMKKKDSPSKGKIESLASRKAKEEGKLEQDLYKQI